MRNRPILSSIPSELDGNDRACKVIVSDGCDEETIDPSSIVEDTNVLSKRKIKICLLFFVFK